MLLAGTLAFYPWSWCQGEGFMLGIFNRVEFWDWQLNWCLACVAILGCFHFTIGVMFHTAGLGYLAGYCCLRYVVRLGFVSTLPLGLCYILWAWDI